MVAIVAINANLQRIFSMTTEYVAKHKMRGKRCGLSGHQEVNTTFSIVQSGAGRVDSISFNGNNKHSYGCQ